MQKNEKNLAQQVADTILSMITVEKSFLPGDKLPNEIAFSEQLRVSRTTLREAIRILASHNVLEIRRGRGTFVVQRPQHEHPIDFNELSKTRLNIKALYELRLMVEPQTAYYAAKRATGSELALILRFGREEERLIRNREDRTQAEQAFHQAIAKAGHNEFVERLMPMIYEAIDSGVRLSEQYDTVVQDTLRDHRMLMEFLEARDALGAKTAMELHILHAMRGFGIAEE